MYVNTAGEVEARDASSRIDMTDSERRSNFPHLGNDMTILVEEIYGKSAGNNFLADKEVSDLNNSSDGDIVDDTKTVGGKENENKRNNSGGIDGISKKSGNQRERHSGDNTNISNESAVRSSKTDNGKLNARWGTSTNGGKKSLDMDTSSIVSEEVFNREKTDGRRFLEAIEKGDEVDARKLLDNQAKKNGFTPANVYHGTRADSVFTQFNEGAAIWNRMKENYPSFVIDEKSNIKPNDIQNKKFVLIDDNSTTGKTFIGLKNIIEENGGNVVGYYALTTGQDQSEKMVTTDKTWKEVTNIGLDKVKDFAEKEGIKREISKLGLSERETQELIKRYRNTDSNFGRSVQDGSGIERRGDAFSPAYERNGTEESKKSISGAHIEEILSGEKLFKSFNLLCYKVTDSFNLSCHCLHPPCLPL